MEQKYLTGTLKIVYAAVCLSLCLVLPFLTGQIPEIGSMLSPMHLPVLLCGFLCGWQYGLAVGAIAAPLRFLLFSMPPFPGCLFMAFEMAVYGLMTGLLYKLFPKKPLFIYINLILSMLAGRIVWGAAQFALMGLMKTNFSFQLFLSGAFLKAIPGIICQIILVPLIVIGLQKTKYLPAASSEK
ncbi:MAG: ECF transporter S component [Clostridia bacterium]